MESRGFSTTQLNDQETPERARCSTHDTEAEQAGARSVCYVHRLTPTCGTRRRRRTVGWRSGWSVKDRAR